MSHFTKIVYMCWLFLFLLYLLLSFSLMNILPYFYHSDSIFLTVFPCMLIIWPPFIWWPSQLLWSFIFCDTDCFASYRVLNYSLVQYVPLSHCFCFFSKWKEDLLFVGFLNLTFFSQKNLPKTQNIVTKKIILFPFPQFPFPTIFPSYLMWPMN